MVLETPARFTPILCVDLNSGQGLRSKTVCLDDAVGPFSPAEENEIGKLFHDFALRSQMTLANTTKDIGHTFVGA